MLGEICQFWTEFAELRNNVCCCLIIRNFAGGFADRCIDIHPGQRILPENFGFTLQVSNERRFILGNYIPHHIQGCTRHAVDAKGLLEHIVPAASLVQLQAEA
ncbi:hypothetical protein D3C80_1794380 [compost metagenome]